MTLGQRVRRIREAAELTQAQLAAASGVSASTIARIEQDVEGTNPTVNTLMWLAKSCGQEVRINFRPITRE